MVTKNLTILFTDVKGFTDKTANHSRRQIESFLKLQDEVIKPRIANFKGKLVKTIGDSYMATFESPTNAVLAAVAIQESVAAYNEILPKEERFSLRVGINSGEVNVKKGDVFGVPVNVASRVESLAQPGGVYLTEAVYLAMNKNEIPAKEVGFKNLKGVKEEVRIYQVIGRGKQSQLFKASFLSVLKSKGNKQGELKGRGHRYLLLLVLLFLFLAVGEYRSLVERDKVTSSTQEIKGESTTKAASESEPLKLDLEESVQATPSNTPTVPEPTSNPDGQTQKDRKDEDDDKKKREKEGHKGRDKKDW